jgi:DNA (cytosine-5)-methyltransferase 1
VGPSPQSGVSPAQPPTISAFDARLRMFLKHAEELYARRGASELTPVLGPSLAEKVFKLASLQHAARGVAVTLLTYKSLCPQQDIRQHKSDFPGGFNARGFDTESTVKLLRAKSLKYSVESHWMTRTLAERPFNARTVIKTQPKQAGSLLVDVLNKIENKADPGVAAAAATLILYVLIDIRSKSKVPLTRPKQPTIDQVLDWLNCHFLASYEKNAPRLPQVAMYAIYQCLMDAAARYEDLKLAPLARMKAADRKAGTVGDVVVLHDGRPYEAVEVKHKEPVSIDHVQEAVEKLRTASVQRYFILSTADVNELDRPAIHTVCQEFLASNGCEIIVNGIQATIRYYLRLLDAPSDFILRYADLVETDEDLGYEHRIRWNACCESAAG